MKASFLQLWPSLGPYGSCLLLNHKLDIMAGGTMKLLSILITFFFAAQAFAEAPRHGFTKEQQEWMATQNNQQALFEQEWQSLFTNPNNPLTFGLLQDTIALPVAEYNKSKYLIFSSEYDFNSFRAKKAMAKNLPSEMTLVIFTWSDDDSHIQSVKNDFLDVIDEDRLKVIYLPRAHRGFWARDGIPVPVYRTNPSTGSSLFTVVDARYYHTFEADDEVADHFSAELTRHSYYYEGGNFMANAKGDCLVVNKTETAGIPDSIFEDHYGCRRLIRLPHVKGIGHADESVKFVSDNVVLTDTASYVSTLENAGFTVKMLPRPQTELETYVNSLIVNDTVYVPIFNQSKDEAALDVYRNLGYDRVIGIPSVTLSNQGAGSLHCITMTYPDVPFAELLQALDGQ